jgi:hypothetical protein
MPFPLRGTCLVGGSVELFHVTRAPLHSSAVRHEVPVGPAAAALTPREEEGDAIKKLRALETSTRFFCDLLTANGLDGQQLRKKDAPTRELYAAVTEPHSKERVLQLRNTKTAGQLFLATGGRHCWLKH